ncbi:MAG TPA: amidase family protein, partial [Paracoccaceae bacterium]|nr:amidase family protein [Paracoccaceae bacterium]
EAVILPLMDDAASALSLTGAKIAMVQLPDYQRIEEAGSTILLSEQVVSHWIDLENDPAHVGRMAYSSLKSGVGITGEKVRSAREIAAEFTNSIDAILAAHDVIILPTTMTTAPAFSDFDSGEPVWTAMRTIPFNLSGHPALTVPAGFHQSLPLGMQIVGARGADALVLKIGAAFEAATDHGALRPYWA